MKPITSPKHWSMRLVRLATLFLLVVAVMAAPDAQAKGKSGKHKKKHGHTAPAQQSPTAHVINHDILAWLLANNPGLKENFLKTDPPDKSIKLPNGQTVPIYRLKQFLEVNFRLTFFARKKEKGSNVVPVMEERLRKLMARPEFRERILTHKPQYKINRKKVSSAAAYDYFRNIKRHLGVTAGRQFHAPVGGGGGIAAPSWAVWKAMNIFFHEACHCLNIGHDSGGLSGPIAGSMRKWDRKKLWNYETIDLNSLSVPKN